MGSSSNSLSNASSSANQNMSPAPAGSPVQACGSAPASSTTQVSPTKEHWISIQLLDEEGHAVPNEDYKITLPDGSTVEGTLDQHGRAKISGLDSGNCKVSFPDLDGEMWKPK
jgi:uncharacterized protein (DUF2345 family)